MHRRKIFVEVTDEKIFVLQRMAKPGLTDFLAGPIAVIYASDKEKAASILEGKLVESERVSGIELLVFSWEILIESGNWKEVESPIRDQIYLQHIEDETGRLKIPFQTLSSHPPALETCFSLTEVSSLPW